MIVVLADGTRLTDISMNGDNFISTDIIDNDVFVNNLSPVKIVDDDNNEIEHAHMKLLANRVYQGQSWFVLEDIPDSQFAMMKLQGDIEYIAMMSDIDLD